MKIGVDIRVLMDKQYSGVSEYTHNLLKALLDEDKNNQYCLFYNSGKDIADHIPKFPNAEIIFRRYPNKIFNYFLQKFVGWPKIDKFLGVNLFFMPHFNFISLSSNSKKIITIHDLSFLKFPHFFSLRKNFWHYMVNVKKLIKNADHIIAISQSTKNDIEELCKISGNKISVIYSGLSNKFYKIKEKQKLDDTQKKYSLPGKFILFLGTIEPRKNIENLISAFEYLISNNKIDKNYNLVIAGGKGWKCQKIYNKYKNSPYRNRIHFIGYIDDADKASIYSMAEIFVYASLYEGFGFPILEAMACETPVIASANSSLAEVADNAALITNPHDIHDLANSIELLTNDKSLQNLLINRGLERIKIFNWTQTAREYIEIFNNKGL